MNTARATWPLKTLWIAMAILVLGLPAWANNTEPNEAVEIDYRIWSISYWQDLAERGLIDVAPDVAFEPAIERPANELDEFVDSPDVCTTGTLPSHQSENSIFVDPNDPDLVLNSNNSSDWPLGQFYGVSSLPSFDGGLTWGGTIDGWGGGDPAAAIDNDGIWYLGHIGSNNSGNANGCTVSTDQGQTYTTYEAGSSGGAFLDKNHLWVDNTGGPYDGRVYAAWTPFGGTNDSEIEVTWSGDNGQTWNNRQVVSLGSNAGYLCQGVNLDVGPNGEVYAIWTVYETGLTEYAIGFAKSLDGGVTWETAYRIIENTYGIRSYTGMDQNHRKNSFPVMTVDVSGGPNNGNIYVAWTNVGVPGINSGPDVASWLIKSTDGGTTWSDPVRIQTDDPNAGNQHYFIWIHCDPVTGTLNGIWYDNRDTTGGAVETWIGYSFDAGDTWENYRSSDVAFTPAPIPGFATGYFGDYLGIYSYEGTVYPCWTDNRDGVARTYVSPFQTEVLPATVSLDTYFTEPIIVPNSGGVIEYDAQASYNLDTPVAGQIWTQVQLPNSNLITMDIYNINFTPGWSFEAIGRTLNVPAGAPIGVYYFIAKVGLYPNYVVSSDQFEFRKIQFDADGATGFTGSEWFKSGQDVADLSTELPSTFGISGVYPNPFNPETRVSVTIPDAGKLSVRVYNTLGQQVAVLADGSYSAGTHQLTLDGSQLASGVYLVRAEMGGQTDLRKVTLMK